MCHRDFVTFKRDKSKPEKSLCNHFGRTIFLLQIETKEENLTLISALLNLLDSIYY